MKNCGKFRRSMLKTGRSGSAFESYIMPFASCDARHHLAGWIDSGAALSYEGGVIAGEK